MRPRVKDRANEHRKDIAHRSYVAASSVSAQKLTASPRDSDPKPRDPGDEEILIYAFQHSQILITLDKDFGELAVVHERPHAGIVRRVSFRAEDQGAAAVTAIAKYGQDLLAGAIVTVEPGRVRVRPRESLPESLPE